MRRADTGADWAARRRTSVAVALGLPLAILLDTVIQLLCKLAISSLPSTSSLWVAAGHLIDQKVIFVVALLMVGQLVNWLWVLDSAELSFALPMTSLSFVSVCVLSNIYFDESIG